MQSQQSIETSREKPSLLSKAGMMTLQKEKYQQPNERQGHRSKILQEVNNDDEFMQLPNVTTSYLPNNNSSIVYQQETKSYRREEKKKALETQEAEYEDVTQKIRQSSQAAFNTINKKKYQRVKKFNHEIDNELQDVQEIIGEIQKLMEDSLSHSKVQSQFKKDTAVVNHSAKRHFQTKGIRNFGEGNGIDKLQEMLLSYQTDDPQLHTQAKTVEVVLKDPVSHRRAKHEERMNRFKEINEVSQSITSPQGVPEASNKSKVVKERKVDQKKLGLQNIEIIQIDWFKLPLFLAPLSSQCAELLLKMTEYPDDESFWIAINESLPKETQYSTYSIFNSHFQAGLRKQKTLMSEQQFREKWAEEWSYEIDEEQHKELLCQLDFQWYRSLVQATFNQSIEDLLVKNISYKWQHFNSNLKKIHGSASNDKNHNSLPLFNLITQNKLKYIEALLNSLARDKVEKTHTAQLFVAVVPNMGQSQSKEVFESLKSHVKEIFVGALYASDSSGSSMGVIITKKQASDCQVKKWQGGRVQLGNVELVINQPQGGSGDLIHLSRVKSKNSSIKLKVFRPGEQGIDLQVGEELYLGRRYHILLD